ncbi:ATPase AAA [Knoellia sinensis KCTC 19936]|uniref:ATPase AAA n=1 Tax=Knoellia sinensis KCTC 19936 TaxID=1385520 RepID=A0A0A0J1R4_9MICO|nr:ATPase AAA [Knoellia sinensis KCTC 19936]
MRRIDQSPYAVVPPPDVWPVSIPAVAQVLADGLDLGSCTILVGDNGTGKSTLVEAIAMAFGLGAEGGSTGARHRTHETESGLWEWLRLSRGPGASKWGYFVRAETMHGLMAWLDTSRSESPRSMDPDFHARSHGESFVSLLSTKRFDGDGLFVWDEPEAGLSFQAQLHLVAELAAMAARPGAQVLLATHSPILAAVPGARILQLSDEGIEPVAWEDLAVVDHHRRFLDDPRRYLRHVLD